MEPSRPEIDFEDAYRQSPPWETGRPQPAVSSLAAAGALVGPVLDIGCGTGENALELAAHGLEVVGLDASRLAIAKARAKAEARSLPVRFLLDDVYDLHHLEGRFPTVLDSGLLHIIDDRSRYASQLATVIEAAGKVILLEISDRADIPYPKISEAEIRATFQEPDWQIEELSTVTYETTMGVFPAWLGVVRPTGSVPTDPVFGP